MAKKVKQPKKKPKPVHDGVQDFLDLVREQLKEEYLGDCLAKSQELELSKQLVSVQEAQELVNLQIKDIVPDAEEMNVAVDQDGNVHFSMNIKPMKALKYVRAEIVLTQEQVAGLTNDDMKERFTAMIEEIEEDE